jgi:hypothetical protein
MKLIHALDFQYVYEKLKNQSTNIRLAYKLNKLNNRLAQEAEFCRDELLKILSQYAQADDEGNFIPNHDGTGYLIKDGLVIECQNKVAELQSIEIEDLNITFTLDELDNITITPAELSCIESLIVE